MYQDTYIKGQITSHGERECQSRYDLIKPELSRFNRRFSVLDIGASEGYFSFRAANDFDCVSVMLERSTEPLMSLCKANDNQNVVFLNHDMSIDNIRSLSTCEHFDVVLAMNVLHHFDNAVEALNSILLLGDLIIIEIPLPEDINSCGQHNLMPLFSFVHSLSFNVLGLSVSHVTSGVSRQVGYIKSPKTCITRQYLDVPNGINLGSVSIQSDYNSKAVTFYRKSEHRPWIEGINLRTYQLLGGVWPVRSDVSRMVESVPVDGKHGDIHPWNFILEGPKVTLIDGADGRVTIDDNEGIHNVASMFL